VRRNFIENEDNKMNLVRNISAMEQELQKLKAENKRLLKNHR
jgi:hypothetical protein